MSRVQPLVRLISYLSKIIVYCKTINEIQIHPIVYIIYNTQKTADFQGQISGFYIILSNVLIIQKRTFFIQEINDMIVEHIRRRAMIGPFYDVEFSIFVKLSIFF